MPREDSDRKPKVVEGGRNVLTGRLSVAREAVRGTAFVSGFDTNLRDTGIDVGVFGLGRELRWFEGVAGTAEGSLVVGGTRDVLVLLTSLCKVSFAGVEGTGGIVEASSLMLVR